MDFTIRIADLNIRVNSLYGSLYSYCRNYLTDAGDFDFSISAMPEELTRQRTKVGLNECSVEYAECIAVLWKIAERLPAYERLLVHGAAITYGEKAFLFTAPSGTGKSTHILHWREFLGEQVDIVNGDKPILSFGGEEIRVHGTPWAGKERWQRNRSAVLHGICVMHQGQENAIRRMSPQESVPSLVKQIYLPDDVDAAGKTLELLDQLVSRIPIYELYCDKSEDAVRCSFEAMTDLRYERRETNV